MSIPLCTYAKNCRNIIQFSSRHHILLKQKAFPDVNCRIMHTFIAPTLKHFQLWQQSDTTKILLAFGTSCVLNN